jgi:hypothetical protein
MAIVDQFNELGDQLRSAFFGGEEGPAPIQKTLFQQELGNKTEIVRQLRSLGSSDEEIANVLSVSVGSVSQVMGAAADLSDLEVNNLMKRLDEGPKEATADFTGELRALEGARGIEAGAAVNTGQGLSGSLSTAQR